MALRACASHVSASLMVTSKSFVRRRLRFSQATVRSTLDQMALAPSYLDGRAGSRGAITAFIPQPISRYFGRVISVKTDLVTNHK